MEEINRVNEEKQKDPQIESLEAKIALLEKETRKKEREISRLQRAIEQEKVYANAKANQLAARTMSQRERDRLLQLLLYNSPDIILFIDRTEHIVYCSNAFLNFVKKTPGFVSGRQIQDVLYGSCDENLIEIISSKLKTIISTNIPISFTGELGEANKENNNKYLIHFTPMTNQDNESEGAMVWFQDITDIERSREAAEKASIAKSEFLSNMSHEMRTPMNAIIGMTNIAKESNSTDRKDYCLKKIEEASNHLLGVINDILDMSKIEANKLELSMLSFDFEKMIQKAVSVINFKAMEKQLSLTVNLDDTIPGYIIGDDQRLTQVITNLLSNAVKFTPSSGTIALNTLKLKEENEVYTIQIEVIDSGIGISLEQQAKLFNSFQQADTSTSRKFGGTGLGLAISKRIVEMMGGTIRVESELGKGSAFIFTFIAESGKEKLRKNLLPNVNWNNVHLMVVDDDLEVLNFFTNVAEKLDIYCDTALDADTALELIHKNNFYDIYFIDWKMPGINGIELSKIITSKIDKNPSLVIIVSSGEWTLIEPEATAIGINMFLPKPLFISDIVDCLNTCIGGFENNSDIKYTDDFSNFKIMLVEDVEINREIVLAMLESTKIKIICAQNGIEAVNLFINSKEKFNMILMDIQMPEMDGYEATRRIRSHEAELIKAKLYEIPESSFSELTENNEVTPIIAMTANIFKEDIEKSFSVGMNDHIGKPLNQDDVMKKLRKYLWKR